MNGQRVVITGASQGIGRAIALRLASRGAAIALVGRRAGALEAVANVAPDRTSVRMLRADLSIENDVRELAAAIAADWPGVDVLVHCAGMYARGTLANMRVEQFDDLYATNVRGPYLLTQLLLPMLVSSRGQIVFVNSTQGLTAAAQTGAYAATQHALKALADSLRDEVNADGVRVLSLFLGRTATPRMESIYRLENRTYQPELLLQPDSIATVVSDALMLPRNAEITNLTIRPLMKSY